VPNVQWETPDDGQSNCPKHVEFLDKNKFGKLVRLLILLQRDIIFTLTVWYSIHIISAKRALRIRDYKSGHLGCIILLIYYCSFTTGYLTMHVAKPTTSPQPRNISLAAYRLFQLMAGKLNQ
jgi:hypothetical protein